MMSRSNVIFRLGVCLVILPWAIAEAKSQPLASTRLDEVDSDFAYQGEYTGFLYGSPLAGQRTGLQVMARGNGRFAAVQYSGGLAGAGWNRTDSFELQGSRQGGQLVLEYGGYRAYVDGHCATLINSHGQSIAVLTKTHRTSSTMGLAPPCGAIVLFDGTNTDSLKNGNISDEGWLQEGAETLRSFRDFQLHVEFRLPYMPEATSQGRANSGVYLQRRYEVQILDSFGSAGAAHECGGIYRQQPPDVNMCLPPLSWQTYDIFFTAAKFNEEGQRTAAAILTVYHNGVAIHDRYEASNKTGAGRQESSDPGPIWFQNHGNPVRFRNIWLQEGDFHAAPVVCEQDFAWPCSNSWQLQEWRGPCWSGRITDR